MIKLLTILTGVVFSLNALAQEKHSGNIVATVRNFTRVKILESNNVSLRPGSVYDNTTYFESLLDVPRPGFNYEFVDSGLGAAEPLYPMYQKGHQGSYAQLIPAAISDKDRHIDHYSSLTTPEGCRVDSIYALRGINEYKHGELDEYKKQGYTQVVTRLEYYTRMRPDAQCGRHRANDPDPKFDPVKFLKKYHKAMSLRDFPAAELARFEAKFSVIYHMEQKMHPAWPKFDLSNLARNTLWYYPDGHDFDYGVNESRAQPGLAVFSKPEHMIVPASATAQTNFGLSALVSANDFKKIFNYLSGQPLPGYAADNEPGHDTLRLSDVTSKNIYTSGLYIENINDVVSDVSDMRNFRLVAMTIKPYELQDDVMWSGLRVVPQVRFVYQMVNPRNRAQAFEQLFFHLKWDVVDRDASQVVRDQQHKYFLSRVDQLTAARVMGSNDYENVLANFIREFTGARPVETIAVSSTLTGIWVFGNLSRNYNANRELLAQRIVRDGVDVGYYSSVYDNDIFRSEIAKSSGERRELLEAHMADITMSYYHDPKRQDVHAISFNRMTCAQCHQTSARDGVHVSLNDKLDRRNTSAINPTEYFFREADDQLQTGQTYWQGH